MPMGTFSSRLGYSRAASTGGAEAGAALQKRRLCSGGFSRGRSFVRKLELARHRLAGHGEESVGTLEKQVHIHWHFPTLSAPSLQHGSFLCISPSLCPILGPWSLVSGPCGRHHQHDSHRTAYLCCGLAQGNRISSILLGLLLRISCGRGRNFTSDAPWRSRHLLCRTQRSQRLGVVRWLQS